MWKRSSLIYALAAVNMGIISGCMSMTGTGDAPGDMPGGSTPGGILYYARTDGAVAAIDVTTSDEVSVLSATAFAGANPGFGRGIAFDPVTRLMWYSATDGQIHSVNIDTEVAGPTIGSIPGAITGAGRHLFIDYAGRRLLTPITDGTVQMYDLADQQDAGSLPSALFAGGNVGGFRHFASDIRSGNLWYAVTDGSFQEIDLDTETATGRTISFGEQVGADPGAFRHFVIDPERDLLLYVVTDGSIASIDLTTLTRADFVISSGAFSGADPGAGRTITYDSQ